MSEHVPTETEIKLTYMLGVHGNNPTVTASDASGEFDRWLEQHDREVAAVERAKWEDWLFKINYPFEYLVSPPPPTTAAALARIWNERDEWGVTDAEATATIAGESGLPNAGDTQ